jgi:5-deoxy-glucuronate isomerase
MAKMNRSKNILVKPNFERPEFIKVTPKSAGWEHLNFSAVKLEKGTTWHFDSHDNEMALVILGGTAKVETKDHNWESVGSRNNVFNGMPTTLYVSRNNGVNIKALSEKFEFGIGWCKAFSDHPTKLIEPEDVKIEIRGGGNATRQINQMIMPGFNCDRLVVVEVYHQGTGVRTPPINTMSEKWIRMAISLKPTLRKYIFIKSTDLRDMPTNESILMTGVSMNWFW